jgi:hypothetical protein
MLFGEVESVSRVGGVTRIQSTDTWSKMNSMMHIRKQPQHSPNGRASTWRKRLYRMLACGPQHSSLLLAVPFLFLGSTSSAQVASASTNWEGLVIELNMPKTNFVTGEQILASIVVSNSLRSECVITSLDRDPCKAGFGEFLIIEQRSGKRVHCAVPMNQRIHGEEKQHRLLWHESKEFAAELVGGYAITNSGVYTVQAMGKFRLIGPPDKHCPAVTPPIYISFSRGM